MRSLIPARAFSSLRQVVLKQNSASPFEAFELKTLEQAASAPKGSVRVKLVSSVVGDSDVYSMKHGTVGAAAGKQGLLEVVDANGSSFAKGDRLVAMDSAVGLWQSEAAVPAEFLTQVPSSVSESEVADFIALAQSISMVGSLKAGDVVIVTGAESPLGLATAFLGKKMSLKVVGVVGGTIDSAKSMQRLTDAGASIVAAEDFDEGTSYMVSAAFRRLVSDLPPTKVAIEGRGGLYAHEAARTLGQNCRMYVTGGGPLTLPSSLFTERNIMVSGSQPVTKDHFDQAAKLLKEMPSALRTPAVTFTFDEVAKAVDSVGLGVMSLLKA